MLKLHVMIPSILLPQFVVPLEVSKVDVYGIVVTMVVVGFKAMLEIVGAVVELFVPLRPTSRVLVVDTATQGRARFFGAGWRINVRHLLNPTPTSTKI